MQTRAHGKASRTLTVLMTEKKHTNWFHVVHGHYVDTQRCSQQGTIGRTEKAA